MATYPRWKALGRQVKKGEEAIMLCMPITVKRKHSQTVPDADEANDITTWFVCKPRWFVLSQTDGEPLPDSETPDWDAVRALEALTVQEIPFDHVDGNCLGFARDRVIAVNPVNPLPHKTRFHETRTSSSATPPRDCRPTATRRRAPSANARPKPWHSSAARRSNSLASTRPAATSSTGGVRGTRSPNPPPGGFSRWRIRS